MKFKLLFVFVISSLYCFGQTSDNKNNFSGGGGKESYNGDLGNSWFNTEEEFYGFFSLSYSRYLNKSFDGTVTGTTGDFGRCAEDGFGAVRADGSPILNMRSRMTAGVISLKYKFYNGYLLKEDSKIEPYLFAGAGMEDLEDIWTHCRVDQGMYFSVNAGAGVRYNFTAHWNYSYTLGFGYFNKQVDWRTAKLNAAYLQSNFMLGYNF